MNVRMMAIGTLFASGAAFGAVSTANYVQDGLVVMLDGIANAAGGVLDATATTWTDLKGGLSSAVELKGGYTWGADVNPWLRIHGGMKPVSVRVLDPMRELETIDSWTWNAKSRIFQVDRDYGESGLWLVELEPEKAE